MKLSNEVQAWADEMLAPYEVIFLGVHGSTLYGLDSPESDIDLKAVVIPTVKQLIHGEFMKTRDFKNPELDVEMEVKSLQSFIKSAKSCDTNCIDLLHMPDEMIIINSDLWKDIMTTRGKLFSKSMKGIIGYIKTHSKKYTNKIDRLTEMKELQEIVSEFVNGTHVVKDVATFSKFTEKKFKYISVFYSKIEGEHNYLEVCGKKFIFTLKILDFKNSLKSMIDGYGERSNKGADKGIDAKSLSHALRVLYQLKEIVTTSTLEFPLKDVQIVRDVKFGKITDVGIVLDMIDVLYDECMELLETSDLPAESCVNDMVEVVEEYYSSLILEGL